METFDLQREKRLVFAKEIRKKNRTVRMNQIRLDKEMREEVWRLINSFCLDTMNIDEVVERMRSDKIYEANASCVFGEWLTEEDRELKIEGKIQICNWGFILVNAAIYNCQIIEKVLCFYLHQILSSCAEHNDFDTVFVIFHAFLQAKIENSTLWGDKEKIVSKKIEEFILFKTSDEMLSLYPITIPELNVYKILHLVQLETFIYLAQNKSFLSKMCASLGTFTDLEVIIKALHFINQVSFYENEYFKGSTESLLEMGLKGHLEFILELFEPSDEIKKNLILCVLRLINNIIFDIEIEFAFESLLISLIQKFTNSEDYEWEIVKTASICLASIVQEIMPSNKYLEVIRDKNTIDLMLSLMNEHGDKDRDFLEKMIDGLKRLLEIGKEQLAVGSELNRYMIKIRYYDNYNSLLRFERFKELIESYEITD